MTEQNYKEAIEEIRELFRETDARFKETDARFKETDKKFQQLEGLFGNQWGRLLEALVEPGALKLFQARGIGVNYMYQRALAQYNGRHMEIDLLMENGHEVIAVEAKSQLRIEFVDDFLDDLAQFHLFFPKYQGCHLYGAVAGLDPPSDVARYAYKKGLFVLSISGNDTVTMLNDDKFRPKDFAMDA